MRKYLTIKFKDPPTLRNGEKYSIGMEGTYKSTENPVVRVTHIRIQIEAP